MPKPVVGTELGKLKSKGQQESRIGRFLGPAKQVVRSLSPSYSSGSASQQARKPSPSTVAQSAPGSTSPRSLPPPESENHRQTATVLPVQLPTTPDSLVSPTLPRPAGGGRGAHHEHQTHLIPASSERQTGGDIWSEAFKLLSEEYKKDLDSLDKLDILQKLFAISKEAQEKNLEKQFKIKWGDKEIDVREKAESFVRWLNKFKQIGDIAVQYDPIHAVLPWAGVRFILMVSDPIQLLRAMILIAT